MLGCGVILRRDSSSFSFAHSDHPFCHFFFIRLMATIRIGVAEPEELNLMLSCMGEMLTPGGRGECQSAKTTVPKDPSPTFFSGV